MPTNSANIKNNDFPTLCMNIISIYLADCILAVKNDIHKRILFYIVLRMNKLVSVTKTFATHICIFFIDMGIV